jgi:hypothetical protein
MEPNEILPILREAREFLSDERLWCRRGTDGVAVIDGEYVDTFCAAWSIRNAVQSRSDRTPWEDGKQALYREACAAVVRAAGRQPATATSGGSALGVWNDHPDRTHADVLAAFDEAISAVEREAVTA